MRIGALSSVGAATLAIVVILGAGSAGCASNGSEATWQHADGSSVDAAALENDKLDCVTEHGAPAPQAAAPMVGTRNAVIDCMRRKGWVKR